MLHHPIRRVTDMAFAQDIRSIEAGLAQKVSENLRALADSYAKYRLYRRTVRELSELSAADLADIGLNRGAIISAAREAVYGK